MVNLGPAAAEDAGAEDDDRVTVGQIGPARGVRGEVFVRPWTDAVEQRFAPGARLQTEPADRGPLTVADVSASGAKLVVHFAGVDDRAAAEALRGVRLWIHTADRPPLNDPEEFYDTELIGLQARDGAGAALGRVSDVVHAGGADFLVIDTGGREHLVPFVAQIVPAVDVAGGYVVLTPPEGLFEL